LPAYTAFAQASVDCNTAPLPGNSAFFRPHGGQRVLHGGLGVREVRGADVGVPAASGSCAADAALIVNGADDALFPPPAGANEKLLFTR
jgi:hypothetical protein